MNRKLLIFDLDGTLIDSKVDIAHSINYALSQSGLSQIQVKKIFSIIGFPLAEAFHLLKPELHPHQIAALVATYRAYYEDHWSDHTTIFPHVRETLGKLTAHRKAVASTKYSQHTNLIVKTLDLQQYFDLVLGTDPESFPAKPDPAIVHKVMDTLGFSPSQTLMIGDTDKDILAGKNAGVVTCAVTYGIGTKKELAALKPDYIINSFSEILEIVS